jgi:hypothetical protein
MGAGPVRGSRVIGGRGRPGVTPGPLYTFLCEIDSRLFKSPTIRRYCPMCDASQRQYFGDVLVGQAGGE